MHPNPQVRRMHEAHKDAKPPGAKPIGHDATEGGEGEAVGHVELHKEGGKYHTIHHPSGERKDHESLHQAHHAMNDHMGEDGCKDANCQEHGGDMESAAMGNPEPEY